jgi:hypothetical protein
VILAFVFFDWQVVDAGDAQAHNPCSISLLLSPLMAKRTCRGLVPTSPFEGKADIQGTQPLAAFRAHVRHQLSDSTLTRHFDGQILDPGSLNWLRIEVH